MVLPGLGESPQGQVAWRPVRRFCAHLPYVLGVLALVASPGTAATINFDDLPAGFCLPVPACAPASDTILSNELANMGVVFGRPGQSMGVAVVDGRQVQLGPSSFANSIVGLDAAGSIPDRFTGSIFFGFFHPTSGNPSSSDFVSFQLGDGGGDADSFEIRAYGLDDQMLMSFIQPTDPSEVGRFPVEVWVNGIHRIEIERMTVGTGTQFGYSLDDLSFELADNGNLHAMPEPSTWLMLVSGLAGCLALKRFRRRGPS